MNDAEARASFCVFPVSSSSFDINRIAFATRRDVLFGCERRSNDGATAKLCGFAIACEKNDDDDGRATSGARPGGRG